MFSLVLACLLVGCVPIGVRMGTQPDLGSVADRWNPLPSARIAQAGAALARCWAMT